MHISSSEKKVRFKESSSVKVHEWVSCLAIVDVNNSFTHIHNPLLLLIHRSMDAAAVPDGERKENQKVSGVTMDDYIIVPFEVWSVGLLLDVDSK